MKTPVFRKFVAAFALSSAIAAASVTGADAQQTIRIADFLPPTHTFYTCSVEQWVKEIKAKAADKIKVNYMGGGTIVGATEILDGVRQGIADMGVMVVDYWPDRLNLASFSSLPYVFPDPVKGTAILRKLMKGEMGANFRAQGIEPVMILLTTPRQISLSNKEVTSLDGIQGLKLRANGWEAKTIEALGATVVSIPPAEVATSQNTGIIDGSTQTYYGMPGWGLVDVTDQAVELRGYTHTLVVLGAAVDKWNAWPQDVKDAITAVSLEIESKWHECQISKDQEVIDKLTANGAKFYRITDKELALAKEKTKTVLDAWLAQTGEGGKKVLAEFEAALK